MNRFFLASTLLVCSCFAANTQARVHDNGIQLNGIQLNGIQLNGIQLNGIQLNGIQLNGIQLNGIQLNGIQLNGIQLNGIQLNGIRWNGISAVGESDEQLCRDSTVVVKRDSPQWSRLSVVGVVVRLNAGI